MCAGVAAGGGAALPGLIFNGKKEVEVRDAVSGALSRVRAGRLECTMQNLVDSLVQRFPETVCALSPGLPLQGGVLEPITGI